MSATTRPIEFDVQTIDLDDGAAVSLKLQATTPRAVAWLEHHGAHAVIARMNALGDKPAHEVADVLQDLLEADAGPVRTQLAPPSTLVSGQTGEFAVLFENIPGNPDEMYVTMNPLSARARAWLELHGDDLVWRANREQQHGERLDAVYQRMLEHDLGPASAP